MNHSDNILKNLKTILITDLPFLSRANRIIEQDPVTSDFTPSKFIRLVPSSDIQIEDLSSCNFSVIQWNLTFYLQKKDKVDFKKLTYNSGLIIKSLLANRKTDNWYYLGDIQADDDQNAITFPEDVTSYSGINITFNTYFLRTT